MSARVALVQSMKAERLPICQTCTEFIASCTCDGGPTLVADMAEVLDEAIAHQAAVYATRDEEKQAEEDAALLAMVGSGDELEAKDFPPLAWAVPGIIPEGMSLLAGAPKAGKSWAVFSIGLALASGGVVFGGIPVHEARPVLYLSLEDSESRLKRRARILLGQGVPIPSLLKYIYSGQLTRDQLLRLIKVWLARYGPDNPLVMIDTLGKMMGPSLMGETTYDRDYRVAGGLKALVDAHPGASMIVVHHDRKAESADFVDSVSGTNGIAGAVDSILVLRRDRHKDEGILLVTGRDIEQEAEYALDFKDAQWRLKNDSLADASAAAAAVHSTLNLGEETTRIIEFVNASPEPVTPTQVITATGLTSDMVRKYLSRAVETGRLTKVGRGLYAPLPRPPVPSVTSVTSGAAESVDGTEVTHVTAPYGQDTLESVSNSDGAG